MRTRRPSRMIARMKHEVTDAIPAQRSTAWARTFAVVYDPFLRAGERAGVRALRKQLVGQARGFTVEVGCGTGLNLPYYADELDELVLAEPDGPMRSRLDKRVRRSGRRARVLDAPAERLPFADQSVDTVVSTFVLCTVDDPDLALREMTRVLRRDGQFLFLEHVHSSSPRLAAWQDRLAAPWQKFARGCRCTRATAELISTAGLAVDDLREETWRAMPPIVRPLIAGRAQIGANDE